MTWTTLKAKARVKKKGVRASLRRNPRGGGHWLSLTLYDDACEGPGFEAGDNCMVQIRDHGAVSQLKVIYDSEGPFELTPRARGQGLALSIRTVQPADESFEPQNVDWLAEPPDLLITLPIRFEVNG